ncbi:ABC transporter substrate-binding protein [Paenibacillus lycopersici]|uniref:ABC transporter substrate-binding protein n=1 Tax=Paenibacillus lycopersici TaxID=2704462 RepID=A0A6C0G2D9_9BACL|nr:ABC transporter substrate-binding protein [Paenibacillus lycopersici]QHT62977.1 ABC transporter substrate-binding protein [Paenibacillus lycopersici]
MKKFKKAFLGMSLVAVSALALAGCGSNNGNDSAGMSNSGSNGGGNAATSNANDSKPSADVVKLTAVFPGQESAAAPNVLKAINEKLQADGLNIAVDIKYIDDYWNKLALNIAGGTQYDLAWAHSSTLSDLVAKKVYQPIDDQLKSDGPDLLANTPDYVLKGGAINGKQYAIARAIPMTGFNNVFNIRGDLREKYGIPKITTIDGLEQYFQAVVKNEPNMLAYVDSNTQTLLPIMANYYFPIGDGGMYPVYVDPADPNYTVKSFLDSPEYASVVNKKKEWRTKGYIAADSSKVDNPDAGFDNGQVAAVGANLFRASERVDTLAKNVPGAKVETVYLEPSKRYIFSAGDNMLAVPSTSKHVKEAVELMNWIKKDQANFDLWSYGVEGTNYKLTDGAVDLSGIADADKYNTNVWMWNDIRLARFSSNYAKADIDELKNWDKNSEVSPFVGFTLDTSKIKSQISQIQAVMNEYSENLGLGVTDINTIKGELMKKMKAAGLQDVIDETQKQINAYIAAK